MRRNLKSDYLWITWGLLSIIALLTIGYKCIASEIEKQHAQDRSVLAQEHATKILKSIKDLPGLADMGAESVQVVENRR